MTDHPNRDARHDRDNDHDRRTTRYSYRDPAAEPSAWKDAFASRSGERYLHFNGASYDGPYPVRDHDRCLIGECLYKSEAENRADLGALYRVQNREPDQDDPEAGL
jgi:hypothetical protein